MTKLMENQKNNDGMEIRILEEVEIRVKERGDGKLPLLEGTAIPYNSRSQLLYGSFYESFAVGALREFLTEKPDVFALLNHDWDKVMGRTASNTLTLTEDDKGVHFTLDPADTSYGRDMVLSVKRGDVRGMSFSFYGVTDEWAMLDGKEHRTVKKAKIREITITPNPAYTATQIMTRSLHTMLEEHKKVMEQNNDLLKRTIDTMKMKIDSLTLD